MSVLLCFVTEMETPGFGGSQLWSSQGPQAIHLPWPPEVNPLIFVAMGFYHVGQAGFTLLTTGYLTASASQSAGTIGISHCT